MKGAWLGWGMGGGGRPSKREGGREEGGGVGGWVGWGCVLSRHWSFRLRREMKNGTPFQSDTPNKTPGPAVGFYRVYRVMNINIIFFFKNNFSLALFEDGTRLFFGGVNEYRNERRRWKRWR